MKSEERHFRMFSVRVLRKSTTMPGLMAARREIGITNSSRPPFYWRAIRRRLLTAARKRNTSPSIPDFALAVRLPRDFWDRWAEHCRAEFPL